MDSLFVFMANRKQITKIPSLMTNVFIYVCIYLCECVCWKKICLLV